MAALAEYIEHSTIPEASDLTGACALYRDTIAAVHEYSAITLETGLVAQLIEEQIDESGRTCEVSALNRLTLGMVELGKVDDTAQMTEAYFAGFLGNRRSRIGEVITGHIAKAQRAR